MIVPPAVLLRLCSGFCGHRRGPSGGVLTHRLSDLVKELGHLRVVLPTGFSQRLGKLWSGVLGQWSLSDCLGCFEISPIGISLQQFLVLLPPLVKRSAVGRLRLLVQFEVEVHHFLGSLLRSSLAPPLLEAINHLLVHLRVLRKLQLQVVASARRGRRWGGRGRRYGRH